ncbi:hypothetical protein BUALT_BualtUnG0041700 [Buddleja alternifolia]|uniref:Reverse transcriptase/retrotransposon-derived protein RNase H-like domain-containing protein n=1 Tax=Buddleja alternifolia TaxID=168488 RepID=A0AAV6W6Z1_9LAMI|nr:hypothetical protein BUALT_BualtUnG0041700 [Buddleja alternifolia]
MEKDNYSCPYSINFTFFEDDPFFDKGKRRRYAESEAYKEAPSRWEGDILKDVIMWPGHTKEGNPTMIHRVFREYFLVLVKRAKPTRDAKFAWNHKYQLIFDAVKQELIKSPTLTAPIPGKPLALYLSARDTSIGVLLAQLDGDDVEKAVYYLSRIMTPTEQRYPKPDKIYLALVFAVQKLRHYMLAHTIHLVTKENPVSVLPGVEMIPHSSSSSEGTEDSFGIGVLLEPWPVTPNLGLESSMINRIGAMENANSPFLLDKERGVYWAEIKEALKNCSSQREYNRLVEFENRDLQIRERKHESYVIFTEMLAQYPALAENAAYTPQECFIDFLNEMRKELDEEGGDVLMRDRREMAFLHSLAQDLRRSGPNSAYLTRILG